MPIQSYFLILSLFFHSFQAVEAMRLGMDAKQAAEYALYRIAKVEKSFNGALITVTKDGLYGNSFSYM